MLIFNFLYTLTFWFLCWYINVPALIRYGSHAPLNVYVHVCIYFHIYVNSFDFFTDVLPFLHLYNTVSTFHQICTLTSVFIFTYALTFFSFQCYVNVFKYKHINVYFLFHIFVNFYFFLSWYVNISSLLRYGFHIYVNVFFLLVIR